MEVINLQTEMIKLIAAKRDELEDFASAYEGYAIIRDKEETALKMANPEKLMKEFWVAVKEGNEEAVKAYASTLASDARNAAVAFAELAAFAIKATEM